MRPERGGKIFQPASTQVGVSLEEGASGSEPGAAVVAPQGVVILPPVPAFYNKPRTLDDIVDQTVARMLDQFGIE